MGMVHRRRCQSLPCVRGGGTVLCTVTEGLQIPAEARTSTCQSLSQPCGCQLPLHKGAEGAGRTYTAPPGALEKTAAFPPHPASRARHLLLEEKASPCGDAKIPSEAGLAPSGSPAAQIYGMMHHFLLEEKALKAPARRPFWLARRLCFRLRYSAGAASGASACAAAAALAALMP